MQASYLPLVTCWASSAAGTGSQRPEWKVAQAGSLMHAGGQWQPQATASCQWLPLLGPVTRLPVTVPARHSGCGTLALQPHSGCQCQPECQRGLRPSVGGAAAFAAVTV